MKVQKKVYCLRVPAALLPAESANCMQSRACFAKPLGELKLKKTEATSNHPTLSVATGHNSNVYFCF
jgi:hypothetical protein